MAIIRFKSRSLIRRFGTKPVEVSDSLAKQYTDRGQAIFARSAMEEVEEEIIEETSEEIEEVEEEVEEVSSDESLPEEKEEVTDEENNTQDQDSEE